MKAAFYGLIAFQLFSCSAQNNQQIPATIEHDEYFVDYSRGPNTRPLIVLINIAFDQNLTDWGRKLGTCIRVIHTPARLSELSNGIIHPDDYPRSAILGDSIEIQLLRQVPLVLVAKKTHNGTVEWIFYAKHNQIDTAAIKNTIAAQFPGLKFGFQIALDAQWSAYTKLRPTEEEIEQSKNQSVLLQIAEHGDNGTKPREINFFSYFSSKADAERFSAAVKTTPYGKIKIEVTRSPGESADPWRCEIQVNGRLELTEISTYTLYLARTARQFNGVFDGWEAALNP